MNAFEQTLRRYGWEGIPAGEIARLQVNVGLGCNLRCRHCHLEASPERTERMSRPTLEAVLRAVDRLPGVPVDVTGGAPELHPELPSFLAEVARRGNALVLRTNLAVLLEPGAEGLPPLFADLGVRLVASLPCYLEENVRAQRGPGVYGKSIDAIRRLNVLGYGLRPDRILDLAYNPGGPFLPPNQEELEAAYRRELGERFGVAFTNLLTLANMPLGRFAGELGPQGSEAYRRLLERSFRAENLPNLMCREQVSVAWDGRLHDCDFNLALGLGVEAGAPAVVEDFDPARLAGRRVVTGDHCFGCAAGRGSSCGGALRSAAADE
ncbi:MAG: arsenosugar biosynthesis radical SAM protein ArsS [Deltaproteobacteria bacterium]|nr:arsenosugar biosynthesis radical SAM protein ArsS [Deltaproteobacteria bacterium]